MDAVVSLLGTLCVLASAGAVVSACDPQAISSSTQNAIAGMVTGVPACCVDGTYLEVPATACTFAPCDKPLVYALCEINAYTYCTCGDPGPGWTPGAPDGAPCPFGSTGTHADAHPADAAGEAKPDGSRDVSPEGAD
jgi:hypothetical protein